MTQPSPPDPGPDLGLSEVAWIRRLAASLVHDPHAADDIAQDALLAALRHPAKGDERHPGWFVRVIRNLSLFRARSEARRMDRERQAGGPSAPEDPSVGLERLELQEELIRAVRSLPDSYRTVVLQRWFEELSIEEIARRAGVPVSTVHTRCGRALALLREDLDRRSRGDRSRWLAAWLPLLPKPKGTSAWIHVMNLKVGIAVAGMACAVALSIWIASRPARVHPMKQVLAAVPAREPAASAPVASTSLEGGASEAGRFEPTVPSSRQEQAADPAGQAIHGRVIDVAGQPLPGVELVFRSAEAAPGTSGERRTSDGTGRFDLALDAERGTFELATSEWTLVHAPSIPLTDLRADCVLVLGKPNSIEGLVVDPSGKPLPDITVLALDPLVSNEIEGKLQDIPIENESPWNSLLTAHPQNTDAQGQFKLTGLLAQSYRLLAKNNRTLELAISEPIPCGTADALVVLGDPGGLCSFAGQVVDLKGMPIPHVSVAAMRTVARRSERTPVRLDTDGVSTDESGRFEMSDKSCKLEGFIVWPESAAPARIVSIGPSADRGALLLRVGHITLARVELRTPGLEADSAEFFDAAGVVCQTGTKRAGGGWVGGGSMSLTGEVRMVSEEATTLVLKLRGKEVARVPVQLEPGRVNLVQP